MENNEFGVQLDVARFVKDLQTSVLDQISALKDDTERAVTDAGAALELSAALEYRAQDVLQTPERVERSMESLLDALEGLKEESRKVALEVARTRMMAGINQVCSRLLCLAILGSICNSGDREKRDSCLEQVSQVLKYWQDSAEQAAAMERIEQMDPLANQLASRYLTLQEKLTQT